MIKNIPLFTTVAIVAFLFSPGVLITLPPKDLDFNNFLLAIWTDSGVATTWLAALVHALVIALIVTVVVEQKLLDDFTAKLKM